MPLTTTTALLAILIMALTTFTTRIGGAIIMSRIPIGPKVERFINAMAGSVLVAVIVPLAAQGDWGARFALLATLVAMLIVRKPLIAITAGVATAALWRLV
ncbi:AzlD family protein [Vreelandella nanhaiensis]|uniref:AzlD domain-containing protein n=1 Tax=Vreelandella nanhaiensis TaxID=1258546 RepID=A0A433KXL4_9GAMM|nr:AzlD domain-containing protein [Halomonas nanhaiensis]RUR34263.1 AzlD domain-containing protein [Halomonas nanhaiensis]